jgi:hypothetical protein
MEGQAFFVHWLGLGVKPKRPGDTVARVVENEPAVLNSRNITDWNTNFYSKKFMAIAEVQRASRIDPTIKDKVGSLGLNAASSAGFADELLKDKAAVAFFDRTMMCTNSSLMFHTRSGADEEFRMFDKLGYYMCKSSDYCMGVVSWPPGCSAGPGYMYFDPNYGEAQFDDVENLYD